MRWRSAIRRIERTLHRYVRYDAEHAAALAGADGVRWTLDGRMTDEATWVRATARVRVVAADLEAEPPPTAVRAWADALAARVTAAHAARGGAARERWYVITPVEPPPPPACDPGAPVPDR